MRSARADQKSYVTHLSCLLARAGRNDEQAFAELHAATVVKMRKTVRVLLPSTADLDDILQDGYLKIWRHAASFDPARASPITWMCTIMRNTAIDALRTTGIPTSELDEALAIPDPADRAADDEFDYAQAEPIAREALKRLPEERRQLLALAYLEGESRTRLSERFGVPVGTIKTWLHRSLAAVRKDCAGHAHNIVTAAAA
ncbi:sigma-70 family RNA polymerase sigma factor [Bradyrhizobium sp. 83012]|uniref:Sigma-70 family RNA polymerase sigma factor n=1 Tax=Bradyrhizobium aeschynomenes TaxID=2734909 RepID=A0ABX2CI62_9BRAD|nr:sigma-70 family RNA polymerase sigma factor [Bradyrhizobium aeschynomenes]NPU66972.1 sigma-70 family RNA polymerase sigma factor [Bradyrhizobium aeschynomenes]NPV24950.1 sigma-70 family RNA polymerase sigma factor [Bradyrhizobium aeschynomenes]